MLSLFSSVDFTSLVPATYRASTSAILQTTLFACVIYVVIRIFLAIKHFLYVENLVANLPGPKHRHFLRGSFIVMTNDGHERLMQFLDWGKDYCKPDVGYMRLYGSFYRPIIVACHPYSMKKILKTAEPKPQNITSGYRTLKEWLGDGLLIAGGDKWARNRRLLTPAFHFDILKPYMNVFNDSTNVFIERLGEYADTKEDFEMFQSVCKCTLDIILRCAFSYETDVQRKGEAHPYVVAVNDLASANVNRMRQPLLLSDFTFYLSAMGKKFKKDCDYVHGVAEDIINKRKTVLEKQADLPSGKYLDFLDILLTAKDEQGVGLADKDIRNEVDTFLFEGHDTTASAISWIMYSLAEHPEYQQKCQEEVDSILEGRDSDDIEWSDLPKFQYLTQCIKEGMRLHCPVAITGRVTTKDFELNGTVFPPGTNVMVNMWMLHHNEDVWGKDHMTFKPDRFTKENIVKMDPYQFTPFSGGPRNCIGQNFAMNEEKTVIAKLLYNFKFSLVPGHVVRKRLAAVMRTADGMMMQVERRKH